MPRFASLLTALLLAGCAAGGFPTLVPVGTAPVSADQVRTWVRPDALPSRTLIRFRWQYKNEKAGAGGRGTARIAPRDSLRLDTAGPLGSGAASAFVIGDSAIWVEPKDAVDKLIPNFPLMWAMFGLPRMPGRTATVDGRQDSVATTWRYAMGRDTLEYRRTALLLQAKYRSRGKVVGYSETTYGPDGALVKARLTVPSVPARLDLTFTRITPGAEFEPDVWRPRAPDSASVDR